MKLFELHEAFEDTPKIKAAKAIGKKYPEIAALKSDNWEFLESLASSISFLFRVKDEKTAKHVTKLLQTDSLAQKFWHVDEAQVSWDKKSWEIHVTDLTEKKRRNATESRRNKAIEKGAKVKINVSDIIPTSRYSKAELLRIAEKVGHQLFDKHSSGLIWGGPPYKIRYTNSMRLAKEVAEAIGEDALDVENFCVDTFSFVIKPSTETGIDASDRFNYVTHAKKLVDVDGNIYVVNCIDHTDVEVIKPVIKTVQEYEAIVAQALGKKRK